MGAPEASVPLSQPTATFSYEHEGDRQFATTLARGLEVLRCFTPLEPLLGNKEISVRTGLPKPTVSRLTYTLTKLGYRQNLLGVWLAFFAPAGVPVDVTKTLTAGNPAARVAVRHPSCTSK